MPKRFSRYQFALKANKGEATANSPLQKYKDYKSGANTVSYTRDPNSNPGGFTPIYLIPFGESEDIYYLNQISDRSVAKLALVGGANELNYILPAAIAAQTTTESSKYTPAAITVFDPSGLTTSPPSQITGVRYKKIGGASYTFPFGKDAAATGANATFKGRAKELKEAATTGSNSTNTATFRPEILRSF